jgi:chromosome segregation ATPase
MNRHAWTAALFSLLSIGCNPEPGPAQPDLRAENRELHAQLDAERKKNMLEQQYIQEATKTINTVHDQLMTLEPIETMLRNIQNNNAEGVAITPSQRDDMLTAIDTVQNSLQNDTKMLEEFRARSQNAEGKVAGLEETISKLQAIATTKSNEIAELRESLRKMSESVTSLQQTHESDQSELEKTTAELRRLTTQLAETTAHMYEVHYLRGDVATQVTQGVLHETPRF